jgi:hypothetical protein
MTKRCLSICILLFLVLIIDIAAQVAQAPPPPPARTIRGTGNGSVDRNVPGATVRGRLVYADTGAPIRYARVGFSKVGSNGYSQEFVKTDENGDFELKDWPAGAYYPVVKNRGILNPQAFSNPALTRAERQQLLEANFQKITISGTGEFQVFLRARRGATISGTIRYFDGEPAAGIKVEALPVFDGTPTSSLLRGRNGQNSVESDDLGVYRFSGLPAGNYAVRATEPVSHRNTASRSRSNSATNPFAKNLFQTYFPGTASVEEAEPFEVFYGQAFEGVNITLPERTLYDISGMVVRKDTREPLTNFRVDFTPISNMKKEGDGDDKMVERRMFGFGSITGSSTNYGKMIGADWSIQNLPNGKYRLTATQQKQYRKPADRDLPRPQRFPAITKDVEIMDGNLDNIIIEVPVGGNLSGTVVTENGQELASYIFLTAVNEQSGETGRSEFFRPEKEDVSSRTARYFDFGQLKEGRYRINYSGRDFYIRSVFKDGKAVGGDTVEIEDGKDTRKVRIVLAGDLATVKGTVADVIPEDETAVFLLRKGRDILLSLAGQGSTTGIKPNGTFEVKAAPGEYFILVLKRSEAPRDPLRLLAWIEEQTETAQTLVLAANEVKTIILD